MTMFSDLLAPIVSGAGSRSTPAARLMGVPPVAYRKLEAGERWPDWETYERIAAAYGRPRTFNAPPI